MSSFVEICVDISYDGWATTMALNFSPVAVSFAKAEGCFVEAILNAAGTPNGECFPRQIEYGLVRISTD